MFIGFLRTEAFECHEGEACCYIGGFVIEFVVRWPHLGHTMVNWFDESFDVQNRRNSPCVQINDVLCYINGHYIVIKLNLMHSFCSSRLYGA